MLPNIHCLKVYFSKLFERSCCNSLTNSVHDLASWLKLASPPQGNLLKGIFIWFVRREGIKPMKKVFSLLLFSVTRF